MGGWRRSRLFSRALSEYPSKLSGMGGRPQSLREKVGELPSRLDVSRVIDVTGHPIAEFMGGAQNVLRLLEGYRVES